MKKYNTIQHKNNRKNNRGLMFYFYCSKDSSNDVLKPQKCL